MSPSEPVRPLLAARAATDPNAVRLLEMFDKASELLEGFPKFGEVEISKPAKSQVTGGRGRGGLPIPTWARPARILPMAPCLCHTTRFSRLSSKL